jgi:anti-anti-sigma factor
MDITQQSFGAIPIIRVDGDLDRLNASALDMAFRAHITAGNHRLLLDLSQCSYLDSGGLAVIMTMAGELRDDGLLAIVAPHAPARRLLKVVGLHEHPRCGVFVGEQEALSALALMPESAVS